MSIDEDREYYFLQQLVESPGRTLKKFQGSKAKPKELALDASVKTAVEAGLVNHNFVSVDGKGPNKKYVLTEAGRAHFKTLTPFPRPPVIDPKLKAFVLLNVLAAGDRPVTLKQVKATLTPAIGKSFGASKETLTSLLDALVKERALDQSTGDGATADDRTLFRLNDQGKRELVRQRQHADMVFKLTGAAINQLIEHAAGRPIAADRAPEAQTSQPVRPLENPVPMAAGRSCSDDELIREAKTLMSTRGTNGLLPIFELRRHVKKLFGERASGVDEFDKRLKRLRGERLDLISLYDPTPFSRDQLSEAVQGVGELFFYVRNLR